MKRTIILFSLLLIATTQIFSQDKNQVKNFEGLMKSLKKGQNINAVLHYGKCELEIDGEIQEKSIDAIGGMPLDVYEYFSKDLFGNKHAFVAASQTKLIENPLGKGYVYNYVKIKIYENNKVEIIARYLKPDTREETMSETFHGKINNGKNEGGIYLYGD
jgi:hypothetical protein